MYIVDRNKVPFFCLFDHGAVDEWSNYPVSDENVLAEPGLGRYGHGVAFGAGQNILPNPSVEKYDTTSSTPKDWVKTGLNSTMSRVTGGRIFTWCGKIVRISGDSLVIASSTTTATLITGEKWTFSCWLKGDSYFLNTAKIRIVEGENSSHQTEAALVIEAGDNWNRYSVTHEIVDSANTSLAVQIESAVVNAELYFDDAQLEKSPWARALAVYTPDDNLIFNPDFLFGLIDHQPEYWNVSGNGYAYIRSSESGSNSPRLVRLEPSSADDTSIRSIEQPVTISSSQGDVFLFSAFLRNHEYDLESTVRLILTEKKLGAVIGQTIKEITLKKYLEKFDYYDLAHTVIDGNSDTIVAAIQTVGMAYLDIEKVAMRRVEIGVDDLRQKVLAYSRENTFNPRQGGLSFWFSPYRNSGIDLGAESVLLIIGEILGDDRIVVFFDETQENIIFHIKSGGDDIVGLSRAIDLTAGNFYHFFIRWFSGQARIYLDGAVLGDFVAYTDFDIPSMLDKSEFYIGSISDGSMPANGVVSDVFIANYDFSADDISTIAARSTQLKILWDVISNFNAAMCHEGPQVLLSWDRSDWYEQIYILRKLRGYPVDAENGDEIVADDDNGLANFSDLDAVASKVNYYTLFIGAAGLPKGTLASIIQGRALAFETGYFHNLIWGKLLPDIYRRQDATSSQVALIQQADDTTGEVFNVGEPGTKQRGELERFLKNFAVELERIRAKIRFNLSRVDPSEADVDDLGHIAYLFNMGLSDRLTPEEKRSLILELMVLYQIKGSLEGIESFVRTLIPFDVTIHRPSRQNIGLVSAGGSVFFDFEQASFDAMFTDDDSGSYFPSIDDSNRMFDAIDIYIKIPCGALIDPRILDELANLLPIFVPGTSSWAIYLEKI
jgi:hypothetical protein